MDSNIDTAFIDENVMQDAQAEGLVLAYQELYAAVGPGEEKEKEIYLRDYMEFYPISVTADLPGTSFSSGSSRLWDGEMEPGTESYVAGKIGEFFKIPVLPDERWSISLGKNDSGLIQSMGSGSPPPIIITCGHIALWLRTPATLPSRTAAGRAGSWT